MRVLLSVAEMATGGAERIVVELTRALRTDGDEVAVAADSGPFDRLLEGSGAQRYPVPGRGRSPLTAARAVLRVRSATRTFRPAVIHAHNVKATGVAAVAGLGSRGRRTPLVATFHGVRREEYRRAALILRRADAVACVSQDLLEGLASSGLPRERMRVIGNAVPLPEPLPPDARDAIDRELGLGEGPVVSLIGRLVEQKAPHRFFEAAACVTRELPDCRFLVVGDGPLRGGLESLAERLGLTGAIRFTGLRRDARELIARSDVVAFSSDWEGLPMVALEALAAGVPVVSTEVEGMRELLGTGAGVIVPRDADALAREIVAVIRAPDRRTQMGRTGRERIATEFSVERMVTAYQGLYRDLASSGR